MIRIIFVAVSFALIDIITVFKRDVVADKFIMSSAAKGNFLTATFFVVTGNFIAVDIVIGIFVGNIVKVNGSTGFLVIQPGAGIAEVIVLVILAAELPAQVNLVTDTAEVLIADGNHAYKAVSIAVACADTEGAGIHFNYGNFYFNTVRLTARIQLNVNVFKIAQVIYALHTAAGSLGIERLTFFQLHFTGNNIILGFYVALNLEAFNNAFVDSNLQSTVLFHMHVGNTRQDVTVGTVFLFQLLYAFIDILQISDFALLQVKEACNSLLVQYSVAFNFSLLVYRVFHNMVNYLYAFRYRLEFRTQVIEPSQIINSTQILAQACFGKLHSRFGFQSSGNFSLRHSNITLNNLLGNGLTDIGSQLVFLLML